MVAAQSGRSEEEARAERRESRLRERYGLLIAALVVLFLVQGIAPGGPWQEVVITALSASTLGLGAPRRIPAALARLAAGSNAVDAVVRSARSSNAKLRAAGWEPRFPSAATGVPAALSGPA